MKADSPVVCPAAVILLTERLQSPVQPALLRPGAGPVHLLLPPLLEEGGQAGQGELDGHQEGHLAGLGVGPGQGHVASLVQTHLNTDYSQAFFVYKIPL